MSLHPDTTPELEAEGVARDAIRAVQQGRRDAKLHVSDRISVTLDSTSAVVQNALITHQSFIADEVLAVEIHVGAAAPAGAHLSEARVGDDAPLTIAILKAD